MLIDSHCHLDHHNYSISTADLISDAALSDVLGFITIGTSIKDNKIAINLADEFPNVYASVGIYPHEDLDINSVNLKVALLNSVKSSTKVVGIGECGIDISNWQGGRTLEDQIPLFEMQIELAKEKKLPLIIHNRNGDIEILKILKKHKSSDLKGVVHCFSSTLDIAREFWEMGFLTSFSGMITYPSRKDLCEVVKEVPLDMFLVETDSPYLPPQGHRGEVNMPKYVKIVAEKVSEIKQLPFSDVSKLSLENTCHLFGINLCL